MSSHYPTALPEKSNLQIGFMRLTDSAPLIIAQEKGFFSDFGLQVELIREASWANLRDKVAVGSLDAAPMLAPMPLFSEIGAMGIRETLITGLTLGLNGNAITVASQLFEKMNSVSPCDSNDPTSSAAALKKLIDEEGLRPTLATVSLFSNHTLQLRLWLQSAGIDPDRDVRIIVLPPEQMVDSLSRGIIDGYCVGEPWSTCAVQAGIGNIVTSGYQLWNNSPEKVLAVAGKWHSEFPATHLRLRLALMHAEYWLREPENRVATADILSPEHYLNLPTKSLLPSLIGKVAFGRFDDPISIPDFHVFGKYQAGFPWRSQAEILMRQGMEILGRELPDEQIRNTVQKCWRPDLYREAARSMDISYPEQDRKPENSNAETWENDQGITLGADLMIGKI